VTDLRDSEIPALIHAYGAAVAAEEGTEEPFHAILNAIGRFAAQAAPVPAEPVAWRYRYHPKGEWRLAKEPASQWAADHSRFEEEPLYATPPQAHPAPSIPQAPGELRDEAKRLAECAREALLQAVRDAESAAHPLNGSMRKEARESFAEAVAAIDRLAAAIPDGWVMVPREPTVEWFKRVVHLAGVWPGEDCPTPMWQAVQRYHRAMLSAIPEAPAPSEAQQDAPIVGYMVHSSDDIQAAALYPLSQEREAHDAARRWKRSLTALAVHPACPAIASTPPAPEAPAVPAPQVTPDQARCEVGEFLMALAVIRELTGTQQQDLDATINAVRAALATPPAAPQEPAEPVAPSLDAARSLEGLIDRLAVLADDAHSPALTEIADLMRAAMKGNQQ
jgi:hypothetical protein